MWENWIETDSYDRNALAALKADSPSLRALETSGSRLLPHFDGFLLDLFAILFKLNVLVHEDEEVAPSARFYRLLVDEIRGAPALELLRQQTVLDEAAAGLATLLLGQRLLDLLKSERLLTRAEMLDFWNLEHQEAEIAARGEEADTADALQQQLAGRAAARQLAELSKRARRDTQAAQRRLERQAASLRDSLEEMAQRQGGRIGAQVGQTLRDLDMSREEAESWSTQLGGGLQSSPGAKIELGSRLARNPKLKRMADFVGRMRESARALRRKLYERSNSEMYEVGTGAELSRLLPAELVTLRHPLLRRDFMRRLLDGELLLYTLRAREEKGRGPMIVCLDGSSSMAGDKEIWAKAVTLTLLDIARRQRRRFRSIAFSSAETRLQVVDLDRHDPFHVDMRLVFEIAEYFPGGGTDFEKPLSAALECVRRSRHRRADVVLITDGECRVGSEWLADFKREKKDLGFSLFSVLIDVGASSVGVLEELSDRITSVTQLTTEASNDIFLRL